MDFLIKAAFYENIKYIISLVNFEKTMYILHFWVSFLFISNILLIDL